jgi:hypothetical protein
MPVSFTRYSRDQSFSMLGRNWVFLLVMAAGSIVGAFIGGHLLGLVANRVLLPLLATAEARSAPKPRIATATRFKTAAGERYR